MKRKVGEFFNFIFLILGTYRKCGKRGLHFKIGK